MSIRPPRARGGILAAIAALALLGAALQYGLFSHQTPQGQPPMAEIDARSLESLKDDFNAASGQFRLIVLLSPT